MADLHESYRTLGLNPDATLDDARNAWRIRAEMVHPDRLQGARPEVQAEAERQFKELSEAWQVVRTHLEAPGASGPFGPAAGPDAQTRPGPGVWGAGPAGSGPGVGNAAWSNAYDHPARKPTRNLLVIAGVLALLGTALLVFTVVDRGGEPEDYPRAVQTSFMDGCEDSGGSLSQCRCLLDEMMARIPLERFESEMVETGQVPPEVFEAAQACA